MGPQGWVQLSSCSPHRHQSNGAVIARCGQPEVSWWGWRNADDEHLVQSVAKACASDSRSGGSKPSARNSPRDFPCAGDLSDVEFGKESLGVFLILFECSAHSWVF